MQSIITTLRERRIDFISYECSQAHTLTTPYSPLQLGHAVQLIVVAASEALSKGIVLYLQLCNLSAKHGESLNQTQAVHAQKETHSFMQTHAHSVF